MLDDPSRISTLRNGQQGYVCLACFWEDGQEEQLVQTPASSDIHMQPHQQQPPERAKGLPAPATEAAQRIAQVEKIFKQWPWFNLADTKSFTLGPMINDHCTSNLGGLTGFTPARKRDLFSLGQLALQNMAQTLSAHTLDLSSDGETKVLRTEGPLGPLHPVRAWRDLEERLAKGTILTYGNTVLSQAQLRRDATIKQAFLAFKKMPSDDPRNHSALAAMLILTTRSALKLTFDGAVGVASSIMPPLSDEWLYVMFEYGWRVLMVMARRLSREYGGQAVQMWSSHFPVDSFGESRRLQ